MNDVVKIKYYNNVYFEIITQSDSVLKKIKKYLTYEITSFKNNGKSQICLLYKDRFVYCGLIFDFLDFLEETRIEYELIGSLIKKNSFNIDVFNKFIDSLKLIYELTEYQKQAIITTLQNKRQVILSPTSSGKSLLIYVLALSYIATRKNNKKVLIIVPSVGLVNQIYADFCNYSSKNEKINISKLVKKISGEEKSKEFGDYNIIISTWQSAHKWSKETFEEFDMILYDECHGSKANVSIDIMKRSNAEYKIGLTGTLSNDTDSELSEATIQGLFGQVLTATTYEELLDMDFITPCEIRVLNLKYEREMTKLTYQEECDYLSINAPRLTIILKLLVSLKGNTLVLFKNVEYGKLIFGLISKYKKCYYIDGSVKAEEREHIRFQIENDDNCVLVASFGTTSVGVSIKNLHNLVFAQGLKSRIKIIQSIGRMLRKHKSKIVSYVYDIVDIIKYDDEYRKYSYAYSHSRKRREYYDFLKFPVNIKKIDINN